MLDARPAKNNFTVLFILIKKLCQDIKYSNSLILKNKKFN